MAEPTSQISAKGQTTIPAEVRRRLGLQPGDALVYELKGDTVRLRKMVRIDMDWARAVESTLDEWAGPEDDDL